MQVSVSIILYVIISLAIGISLGFLLHRKLGLRRMAVASRESESLLEAAKRDADAIKKEALLQAKDSLFQMKIEFEKETKERKKELQNLEKWLTKKEENLERRSENLENREEDLSLRESVQTEHEKALKKREQQLRDIIEQERAQLENIAGISSQEAKEMLIKAMENDAKHEAAKMIKRIEMEAKENADRRAKNILSLAIKRYAGDYVAEKTVSVVNLPSEEMKGRIIGREGRNIRAIEASTGIDLIIDDTPESVVLSGFNPIRREIARVSLERLISDGRIHPARIEEIVNKVSKEIDVLVKEAGEQAAFDVGVHGIHPELIKLIGKLKYRTSYAQNVLQHSIEVAFLCGIMAAELGLNEKVAKRTGLLHDIGKAVDHEIEGPHAIIGAELAKKYEESPEVVHAIAAHHEDVAPSSVLAVLIQAADALSGARPGARKELLEAYVKRLEDLEKIATSFDGVSKSYAMQAGRELRIIVESDKISDAEAILLSHDIAKKIENELSYPGQIKITVIRETRAVEYAR